jgi:hypothetical protein
MKRPIAALRVAQVQQDFLGVGVKYAHRVALPQCGDSA